MMKQTKSKILHEKYHKGTKSQRRIISKSNFTYRIILPILDMYVNSPNKKVLDVGCGSGTLSLYLASKGNEVHGIDISKKAITASKKSAKDLGLKNASFEALDFPKQSLGPKKYDIILLLEVIEHLENDSEVLKILYSRLNTNGTLILSTPSKNAPLHKIGLTRKFDKRVGHLRRYELNSLLNIVESAGFKIVEVIKNEGVVRNFLFTNPIAGKLLRFVKYFLVNTVTLIDNLSLKIFGESDYIVIARK